MGERALARLRREAVGFVFQAFHLMDELTAVENVELPALLAGISPRKARRRAAGLLEQVGLADRAGFLPSALSGGQRQRVAVARALANEPLVVLADEPTGNLDSEATLEVLRLFETLHAAGQTLVIVTHDARIAATADRLISMRDGAFVDQTRLTGGSTGSLGCPRRAGGLSRGAGHLLGRGVLLGRLAGRDLRYRPAQAALLLLVITAATATLTLGLALRGVTSQPYQRTRAATNGPDVVAYLPVMHRPGQVSSPPAQAAAALTRAAGVTGHSGPYPARRCGTAGPRPSRRPPRRKGAVRRPPSVDQPKLTAGRWVRPGGVVIERTFADALGVGVGDRITLNGRPFTVAGIAVTAASPPYPNLCYTSGGGCHASPPDQGSIRSPPASA